MNINKFLQDTLGQFNINTGAFANLEDEEINHDQDPNFSRESSLKH